MLPEMARARVIIPARLGSKRIPMKNIRLLDGEPLIGHTIRALQSFDLFSEVYVSTESAEIQRIAESYGAKVPGLRGESLAGDNVSTLKVVQDFLRNKEEVSEKAPVFCVYPFALFLDKKILSSALERFILDQDNDESFIVSIREYSHPIERALKFGIDGLLEPVNNDFINIRTQDLPSRFYDAGQFYLASKGLWLSTTSVFSKARGQVIHDWKIMDLDTIDDWDKLRSIWESQKQKDL